MKWFVSNLDLKCPCNNDLWYKKSYANHIIDNLNQIENRVFSQKKLGSIPMSANILVIEET